MKELSVIQQSLNAPKGQWNNFSSYHYRSCEDILEGLKPLLGEAIVTVTDSIQEVSGRIYVKATATFSLGGISVSVDGWAREPEEKKGMDLAQLTGSTSSYARKYALNGLFCIDDSKDADSMDNKPAKKATKTAASRPAPVKAKPADKPATQQQMENIITLKKLKNVSEEIFTKQLVHVGCDNFLEITDAQARKLIVGYSKK